ncbi:MAG TPA: hypothetical protein VKG24_30540 [Pseudolabrys sp.]|nr:hypothetical protein [Pseudolabrys sp.]
MRKRLRYADLVALGIVNNRTTLRNWIEGKGLEPGQKPFPRGQLIGPNSRAWREDEVQAWLEARPAAPKPYLVTPRRPGRPRKVRTVETATTIET